CLQNKTSAYFDTRDLYLVIRTLLDHGFKLSFTVSDIYESNKAGSVKSVTDYISMDIIKVLLPNMFGSIRLLGSGQSRININSQVFLFEDDLLKEDGFNIDVRFEDIDKLSLTIGSSCFLITINKSGFHKILGQVPDTRAKLEKEENERAELYEQMNKEMESFLSDFDGDSLQSILHYLDED
ncbi:MAG: hypothetical protein LIR50_13370, partial [Bacillota bacterium]|nr:hypothetical protein [Bacillota bacterium]